MITASVLIIAYNQERTIRQAIESAARQKTDFDFEIIVGDDFSSDGTAAAAEALCGDCPGLTVIRNAHNTGASLNLCGLVRRAHGEYVAFLEGDDYWSDEHKLQKQVDMLRSNPDCSGCSCRTAVVDGSGRLCTDQYISWIRYKSRFELSDFDGVHLPGQTAAMVYRKSVFTEELLEDICSIHRNISDRSFAAAALLGGYIGLCGDTMSCYRVDGDSVTVTGVFSDDGLLINYRLTRELSRLLKKHGRNMSFLKFRLVLAGKAVIKAAVKKDHASEEALREIISDMGCPRFALLCLPAAALGAADKLSELIKRRIIRKN